MQGINNRNGGVSAYGFALGYVQSCETGGGSVSLAANGGDGYDVHAYIPAVTLGRDATDYRDNDGKLSTWFSFELLSDARKFYATVIRVLQNKTVTTYPELRRMERIATERQYNKWVAKMAGYGIAV